ncbi:MAG: hypothetical protein ACRCZF_02345 [Gemmataceae bacterium]
MAIPIIAALKAATTVATVVSSMSSSDKSKDQKPADGAKPEMKRPDPRDEEKREQDREAVHAGKNKPKSSTDAIAEFKSILDFFGPATAHRANANIDSNKLIETPNTIVGQAMTEYFAQTPATIKDEPAAIKKSKAREALEEKPSAPPVLFPVPVPPVKK